MRRELVGFVYMIHFEPAYHHAQHYVGWSEGLRPRIARHLSGDGSPLIRAAQNAGCALHLVRTWKGTRFDERALKRSHKVKRWCPICKGPRAQYRLPRSFTKRKAT